MSNVFGVSPAGLPRQKTARRRMGFFGGQPSQRAIPDRIVFFVGTLDSRLGSRVSRGLPKIGCIRMCQSTRHGPNRAIRGKIARKRSKAPNKSPRKKTSPPIYGCRRASCRTYPSRIVSRFDALVAGSDARLPDFLNSASARLCILLESPLNVISNMLLFLARQLKGFCGFLGSR